MKPRPTTLAAIVAAARAAGAAIMAWADPAGKAKTPAWSKADASPLTEADLAANRSLAAALALIDPHVPFISEEALGEDPARVVAEAPACWLVDPLDGTKEFLAGTGEFCVNIAYLVRGKPAVGCIYAPVRGVAWIGVTAAVAEAAAGVAYRQAAPGAPLVPVRARRAEPSRFTCLVSRSHGSGELARLAKAYPDANIAPTGSAIKYGLIAEGSADVAIRVSPTSLWDTAAGQALIEAAGGAMLRLDGQPLSYQTGILQNPPFIAVGDPAFPWETAARALGLGTAESPVV